jgi:hypothetical protein
MARWWVNTMDPDKGFIPPAYANAAARVADVLRLDEVVIDRLLQQAFVGNGSLAGGLPLGAWPGALSPGLQFEVQGVLTAAAAATPVILLADSLVPAGKAVYINYWLVSVGGATAWTDATATIVKIQGNDATVALTFAKAGLTGNAMLVPGSASTTLAALITAQSGLTAGKGIQVVADAVFAAGSNLQVMVGGYIR